MALQDRDDWHSSSTTKRDGMFFLADINSLGCGSELLQALQRL